MAKGRQVGQKPECLAYVNEVSTDMRPLSLREQMAAREEQPPPEVVARAYGLIRINLVAKATSPSGI